MEGREERGRKERGGEGTFRKRESCWYRTTNFDCNSSFLTLLVAEDVKREFAISW